MFSFITLWTFIYKFHTFVQQIGKHGLYILREACSGREILFFLMYFQLKCFSNGPLWHVTSRGRSSPGSDDARGASSTQSCITFRLITVTAGLLYDGLGCDEGQSVSSTVDDLEAFAQQTGRSGFDLEGAGQIIIAYCLQRVQIYSGRNVRASAARVQRVRFREAVYPLPVTAHRYSFCLSFIHFRAEVWSAGR